MGNFLPASNMMVTAGLKFPPEIFPPRKTDRAKAAPTAIGCPPVEIITKRKKNVPTNSTKYFSKGVAKAIVCLYITPLKK